MPEEMTTEGSLPEVETTMPKADTGGNPWIKMVPKETAETHSEMLNKYETFDSFVKGSAEAFESANKLKDYEGKTFMPGEEASEETWTDFWGKLGKPADSKDYGIDEEALASMFYKANLTKAQAESISNGLVEYSDSTQEEFKEKRNKEYQAAIETLKGKYGTDLEVKLSSAHTAMKNLGGSELIATLQEKGLDNDPSMIDFFVNVGSLMMEGNIPIGHRLNPTAGGLEGTYDSMKGIE